MPRLISLCIIGDLMLDVVTHIPGLSLGSIKDPKGLTTPQQISTYAGGTGVHLAVEGVKQGFAPVAVIGKIGMINGKPDITARLIIEELNALPLQLHLAEDLQSPTGTAMITFLAGNERLLVYSRGANGSFCVQDITEAMYTTVSSSDIVFVSGYTLLVPDQAKAIVQLLEAARKRGKLTVLDVVPHKIDEFLSLEQFLNIAQHIDVLVSETGTLKRLFPSLARDDGKDESASLAEGLLSSHRALILWPSSETFCVYARNGFIETGPTGIKEVAFQQGLAYLDRVSLHILRRSYDHFLGTWPGSGERSKGAKGEIGENASQAG